MRPHTTAEAAAVCDLVERWQATFLAAIGRRMVYAADEYYLMAERPFPSADTYEGFPQHENGIGMARAFEAAFGGDEHAALGVRPGFFAAVDGAPAAGYRAPRRATAGGRRRGPAPDRAGRRAPVAILTGEYGARVLGPARRRPSAGTTSVWSPSRNDFFGGNIGVSGLLTGTDLTTRPRRPARGAPLPAARRLPVRGPLPRRPDRVATCPGRSRWSRPTASRCAVPSTDRAAEPRGRRRPARVPVSARSLPVSRRRRRRAPGPGTLPARGGGRTAQRRQVDAGQPHRRPPGRRGGGASRRDPRPQGARGRMVRPTVSRSSTPAVGWRPTTRSTPR